MSDLENDELNRQLCAVVSEEMFESWPPEVQAPMSPNIT